MRSQVATSLPCAIYACTYNLHKDGSSAKRTLKTSKKIMPPKADRTKLSSIVTHLREDGCSLLEIEIEKKFVKFPPELNHTRDMIAVRSHNNF